MYWRGASHQRKSLGDKSGWGQKHIQMRCDVWLFCVVFLWLPAQLHCVFMRWITKIQLHWLSLIFNFLDKHWFLSSFVDVPISLFFRSRTPFFRKHNFLVLNRFRIVSLWLGVLLVLSQSFLGKYKLSPARVSPAHVLAHTNVFCTGLSEKSQKKHHTRAPVRAKCDDHLDDNSVFGTQIWINRILRTQCQLLQVRPSSYTRRGPVWR